LTPGHREVKQFPFVIWSVINEGRIDIDALLSSTRDAVKVRFKSLYNGKGKQLKIWADRLPRVADPRNVEKYVDKAICVAGDFIDK
jgi:hypothetical protein